jgi:cytochrome c peroxidase
MFKDAFGDENITIDRIAKAIASFERTFVSTSSAFDEFNNGKKDALSANALRGYKLFTDGNKTNCLGCHNGANFTDGQFHVNGIAKTTKDKGRAELTGNSEDIGKFRTASLRNAAVTWPYMHDGSISGPNPTAALEAVIRRYSEGGDGRLNQDPKIKKLNLSNQDIADLAAFIQSLTDTKFLHNPALQNPW